MSAETENLFKSDNLYLIIINSITIFHAFEFFFYPLLTYIFNFSIIYFSPNGMCIAYIQNSQSNNFLILYALIVYFSIQAQIKYIFIC